MDILEETKKEIQRRKDIHLKDWLAHDRIADKVAADVTTQILSFIRDLEEQNENTNSQKKGDYAEAIQWKGDNLKEVLEFVGKAPKFDEWFKSFEKYEEYVHSHGDIFKVFFRDDYHQEVCKGGWIIKAPDGTICTTNSVMVNHLPM